VPATNNKDHNNNIGNSNGAQSNKIARAEIPLYKRHK